MRNTDTQKEIKKTERKKNELMRVRERESQTD